MLFRDWWRIPTPYGYVELELDESGSAPTDELELDETANVLDVLTYGIENRDPRITSAIVEVYAQAHPESFPPGLSLRSLSVRDIDPLRPSLIRYLEHQIAAGTIRLYEDDVTITQIDVIEPLKYVPQPVVPERTCTDCTLIYHYDDLDETPVRNATFRVTFAGGEIRKGQLDDDGKATLYSVPDGEMNIEYQYDVPEDDDADIEEARESVRQALDAIVERTRQDMTDEWKEWNEAGWLEREYLLTANEFQGMAVGAWEWLSGTVETVWQLAVLLYKVDSEIRELQFIILTGQWNRLDQKIAGYRAQGEEVLDAAGEVKELLILTFHDEETRRIIMEFPEKWWAAIPPDEREELKSSVGTQIAIDVVISVLLAAFTAGSAGVTYGSAKWTQRIGKLGNKVVKLLDKLEEAFKKLARVLRRRKRKKIDLHRLPDGKREVRTKWKGKKPANVSNTGCRGLVGADFEKWLQAELKATRGNFSKSGREFDGAVGSRWLEAKSGRYWLDHAQPGAGFEKFKSDIGAKLRIAKDNNATLEVHSNTPIPQHVKDWLTKKGIAFFEH